MIQIERLRMHLPTGFEHRASSIAYLMGDLLAQQSVSEAVSLDSIAITPQQLPLNTPDSEIARIIVEQIVSGYRGRQK